MTIDSIGITPSARVIEKNYGGAQPSAAPAAGATARPAASALETRNADKGTGTGEAPTMDQLKQAVSEMNQSAQANKQGVEFSIDEESKRTVVKVVDMTTKEVLRQFPTEQALQIAKSLDKTSGLLIEQTA